MVFRNQAAFFAEWIYNTMLYGYATGALAADWVLFLDADEFIDDRTAPGGLAGMLARAPPDASCVLARTINYEAATAATQPEAERHAAADAPSGPAARNRKSVRARRLREETASSSPAAAMRSCSMARSLTARRRTRWCSPTIRYDSDWQLAAKIAVGRLKVLAAGPDEAEANHHYTPQFELMKARPEIWLDAARAQRERDAADPALVEDAIAYRGGDLRHTPPPAGEAEALARVLAVAERIAEAHGSRIGADERARLAALQEAMAFQRLL